MRKSGIALEREDYNAYSGAKPTRVPALHTSYPLYLRMLDDEFCGRVKRKTLGHLKHTGIDHWRWAQ